MTQLTITALHGRTLSDLHVLHHQVQQALNAATPGSDAHRDAVANLDAIRRMIRLMQQAMAPRF